ncbi:hypothetical protein J6590_062942 [Homalodisca vitripennis]|nr:hypothetical protein J6590_062942 [Homalodisca vitripennis]
MISCLACIQRMACLVIGGAFPSAQGVALDYCRNLASLDIIIRATASRRAYCLQQVGLWSAPGYIRGHCKISILIQGNALHKDL